MHLTLLTVGKLKSTPLQELENEYTKRLRPYANIDFITIKDGKHGADRELIKEEEGKNLLSKIPSQSFVVVLDEHGKSLTSPAFSQLLDKTATQGYHDFCFVIGGCYGLSSQVIKRANLVLSFSAFTFTHEMVKILLLEQLYRAFTILNNKTYHY